MTTLENTNENDDIKKRLNKTLEMRLDSDKVFTSISTLIYFLILQRKNAFVVVGNLASPYRFIHIFSPKHFTSTQESPQSN